MKFKRILAYALSFLMLCSSVGLVGTVRAAGVFGDIDSNGIVTDADAIYLLRHTLFPESFPISGHGDFTGDGAVTDADAVYLLRHTLFPDSFPLNTPPEQDEEPVKLTVGLPVDARVLDYYDNALTNWVEEQCGVELDFVEYAGDAASQISTTIAARQELPDILFGISLNENTLRRYGREGYLLDLTPYYEDKEGASKTFWTRLEELSDTEKANVLAQIREPGSGAIYSVPTVTDSLSYSPYQVWINTQWLDKVGMTMPTNLSELFQVLQAFSETDCNGNGYLDEIPLFGSTRAGTGAQILDWIINMFVYYDPASPYIVDETGKLVRVETTDAYREALKFIYNLYKKGLLTSMAFTASSSEMKMITTPAAGNALCGIFVGNLAVHTTKGSPVLYEYAPLPLWGYAPQSTATCKQDTFISSDCANPEKAFEVLMTMWSQEGSLRIRYGEKGNNWTDPVAGASTSYGLPAQLQIISDPLMEQHTANWGKAACCFNLYAEGETAIQPQALDEFTQYRDRLTAEYYAMYTDVASKSNPSDICPKLVLTEDEEEETKMYRINISNRISAARTEFCCGIMDPNNDGAWSSYLAELESMGLPKVVAQAQTAYERQ